MNESLNTISSGNSIAEEDLSEVETEVDSVDTLPPLLSLLDESASPVPTSITNEISFVGGRSHENVASSLTASATSVADGEGTVQSSPRSYTAAGPAQERASVEVSHPIAGSLEEDESCLKSSEEVERSLTRNRKEEETAFDADLLKELEIRRTEGLQEMTAADGAALMTSSSGIAGNTEADRSNESKSENDDCLAQNYQMRNECQDMPSSSAISNGNRYAEEDERLADNTVSVDHSQVWNSHVESVEHHDRASESLDSNHSRAESKSGTGRETSAIKRRTTIDRYKDCGDLSQKDVLMAHMASQLDVLSQLRLMECSQTSDSVPQFSHDLATSSYTVPGQAIVNGTSTVIGSLCAARVYTSPHFESAFKPSEALSPGKHSIQLQRGMPAAPSLMAKYHGVTAVGCMDGSIKVLMPPPNGEGPPILLSVHERGHIGDPPTAMALGHHGAGLLMIVGHSSGQLRFWETRTSGAGARRQVSWSMVKSVGETHAAAITAIAILEYDTATWALAADAHGRIVCHNVNRHLNLAVQALAGIARQFSSANVGSAYHLLDMEAAGQDPGVIVSISPLGTHDATSPRNIRRGPHLEQRTHSPSSPSRQSQSHDSLRALGNFVLIVATRAVLICRMDVDGSVSVLHLFFPPKALQGVAEGYATWRREAPWDMTAQKSPYEATVDSESGFSAFNVILTVAWGSVGMVYRAALGISKDDDRDAGAEAAPLPLPQLLSSFSMETMIVGVTFLASGTLAVLTTSEDTTETAVSLLRASSYTSPQPSSQRSTDAISSDIVASTIGEFSPNDVERLNIPDWLIGRQLGVPGDPSYHGAVTSTGDQALLLTSRGLRVLHMMSWNQRLSALASIGRVVDAFASAARLMARLDARSEWYERRISPQEIDVAGFWPADVVPTGQRAELEQQFLLLLYGILDPYLGDSNAQRGIEHSEDGMYALVDVAIDGCMLVSRQDVLFAEVAPKFLGKSFSKSVFLECLEPRILNDQVTEVTAEVMQALVEHFVAENQPQRVEYLVVKLNVSSLDLNQVIPLCLRHHLFGALIHIFSRALNDFVTPAALLLAASVVEARGEAHAACRGSIHHGNEYGMELGVKLLDYLRSCLLATPLELLRDEDPSVPAQNASALEARENGKLSVIAFLLFSSVASLKKLCAPWTHHMESVDDHQAHLDFSQFHLHMKDPFPVLRFLCWGLDAARLLRDVGEGLADWDALIEDVMDVLPPEMDSEKDSKLTDVYKTVTQATIDAIVCLLEETTSSERSLVDESSARAKDRGGVFENERHVEAAMLRFIAEHVASNRAAVHGKVLMRVLRFLVASPSSPSSMDEQSGSSDEKTLDMSMEERESIFGDIVLQLWNSCSSKPKKEIDEALALAHASGFYQAEAKILHAQGKHEESLRSLMGDERFPYNSFTYIRELLMDPTTSAYRKENFVSNVFSRLTSLLHLNAIATALVVAECFSENWFERAVEALAEDSESQFKFLDAIVAIKTDPALLRSSAGIVDRLEDVDDLQPSLARFLDDGQISSLYVKLLCKRRPEDVLKFLESNDAYDVDICLQHCLEAEASDAAAFLLERRGDVHGALKLHLDAVRSADKKLIQALKHNIDDMHRMAKPRLPEEELKAARNALHGVLSMCARFSQDHAPLAMMARTTSELDGSMQQNNNAMTEKDIVAKSSVAAANSISSVWIEVLEHYVDVLHRLFREGEEEGGSEFVEGNFTDEMEVNEAERCLVLWGRTVLQETFMEFVHHVIREMSEHVASQTVVVSLLDRYSDVKFGRFRGILLDLLQSCSFQYTISDCVGRSSRLDALSLLRRGYRKCMEPTHVAVAPSNTDHSNIWDTR